MPTGLTAGRTAAQAAVPVKGSSCRRAVSLGPEELKVTVGWKDGQMLSFGAGMAEGESRSGRKVRRRVHLGWKNRSEGSRLVKRRSNVPEC